MRFYILYALLICSLVLIIGTGFYIMPGYLYHKTVNRNESSPWFRLQRYSKVYLAGKKETEVKSKEIKNKNLWKKFHVGDVKIPLPHKNPFYFVVPNIQFDKATRTTKFGFKILNAQDDKIMEILFLPKFGFPDFLNNQKGFELPIVAHQIQKHSTDQIWRDVLTKDISNWNIPIYEMFYNLYLLEFRSQIFKDNIKSFRMISENKGLVVLDYGNNDFKAELVMNKRGEELLSFIIISRIGDKDAQMIRDKYIDEVEYLPSTPSLADIILREFKSLKYNEQVDHEGMLYLTSAWSHDMDSYQYIESIIYYLERGYKNEKQLEPFYRYLYYRYDKVFSAKMIENLNLESEIILKKNIEYEEKTRAFIENKNNSKPIPEKKATVEEEYEQIIKDTAKSKKKSRTIRID